MIASCLTEELECKPLYTIFRTDFFLPVKMYHIVMNFLNCRCKACNQLIEI